MNYSNYIKAELPERRSIEETNCFSPAYFEYKSSVFLFFEAYSLFDCLHFEPVCSWQSSWSGKRDPATGEPAAEARKLMRDFVFEQVADYIENLPWDEDGKLPVNTTVKALQKYNVIRFPDILNEQTVETALFMLRTEPKPHISKPTFKEVVDWFYKGNL